MFDKKDDVKQFPVSVSAHVQNQKNVFIVVIFEVYLDIICCLNDQSLKFVF